MSAAEVIASNHTLAWMSHSPEVRLRGAEGIIDALKAAGYAVVELPKPEYESDGYLRIPVDLQDKSAGRNTARTGLEQWKAGPMITMVAVPNPLPAGDAAALAGAILSAAAVAAEQARR